MANWVRVITIHKHYRGIGRRKNGQPLFWLRVGKSKENNIKLSFDVE